MTIQQKLQEFAQTMKMGVVASRSGINPSQMSRMINNGTRLSADQAVPLARALGVSVEWLIDDEQGWPPVYTNQPHAATTSPNGDAA